VPTPVAIALGSNVGDRAAHLEYAVRRLASILSGVRVSSFFETEPVGVEPQASVLNAVVVGSTDLPPRELLDFLLEVERERGRSRPRPGAPRTLDLDLVLFGDRVIDQPGLRVPHPRYRERRFVLEPLAQVAPEMVDPESGQTMQALFGRMAADHPRP
jgi:2-amino-4-hydroxy-6-hydroxymethyldihydropteridine diphosphokinase